MTEPLTTGQAARIDRLVWRNRSGDVMIIVALPARPHRDSVFVEKEIHGITPLAFDGFVEDGSTLIIREYSDGEQVWPKP